MRVLLAEEDAMIGAAVEASKDIVALLVQRGSSRIVLPVELA